MSEPVLKGIDVLDKFEYEGRIADERLENIVNFFKVSFDECNLLRLTMLLKIIIFNNKAAFLLLAVFIHSVKFKLDIRLHFISKF